MIPDPHGILFDLDLTLCRPVVSFDEIYAAVFGHPFSERADRWNEALQKDGAVHGRESIAAVLRDSSSTLVESKTRELGYEWARAQRALPGAHTLLERLHESGRLLGLVTNGPSYFQRLVVAELGFKRYFDAIVVSGDADVASRKPAAAPFHCAATRLGLSPAALVMIGDSLEKDVLGALAAGMSAVWVQVVSKEACGVQSFDELLAAGRAGAPPPSLDPIPIAWDALPHQAF
jgi:HAD superfamily hydrolase (TIGR01509 family)